MKIIHLFIEDSKFSGIPDDWSQANFANGPEKELAKVCDELPADNCFIRPFSELRNYPEVINHFNISKPPVLIVYDDETMEAVGALKGNQIDESKIWALYGGQAGTGGNGTGEKDEFFDSTGKGGFSFGLGLGELFPGGCPSWMPGFICKTPTWLALVVLILIFVMLTPFGRGMIRKIK